VDGGSTPGLGVNRHGSVKKPHSFAHTCETEPLTKHCGLNIESTPLIGNGEVDLPIFFYQLNVNLLCSAVLGSIVERLLKNPKEAQ